MQGSMSNSLWGLIAKSDYMAKGILLILVGTSILCWTIAFYKMIVFSVKKRQLDFVLKKMRHVATFEQLIVLAHQEEKTCPGYLITEQLNAAKAILKRTNKKNLAERELQVLEEQRAWTIDELLHIDSKYLSILSTTAAAAPLFGLMGTVWGLMHSFVSISHKQNADIVTVAPGVAEALLTTLAGIIVAIPALILYSFFKTKVASIEHALIEVSDITHRIIGYTLLNTREIHNETSMVPDKTQSQGTVAS